MIKAIIILMAYLMLPTDCFADMTPTTGKSCAAWTQHRKLGGASSAVDEAWIIGYLTGISASADIDFTRVIDAESIKEWMDNYCHTHPLRFLADGGQALALELAGKDIRAKK